MAKIVDLKCAVQTKHWYLNLCVKDGKLKGWSLVSEVTGEVVLWGENGESKWNGLRLALKDWKLYFIGDPELFCRQKR